jgi:hypothetical protein
MVELFNPFKTVRILYRKSPLLTHYYQLLLLNISTKSNFPIRSRPHFPNRRGQIEEANGDEIGPPSGGAAQAQALHLNSTFRLALDFRGLHERGNEQMNEQC